ncbi:hypothetical protein ACFSKW_15950 [Nonomuraea mangrovi]|uniref:Uncharacterized protein n=1 Tax=Nonomuraea mangrovi TaxID=2316207 RepID=A0ABW4SVL3_9ACTN
MLAAELYGNEREPHLDTIVCKGEQGLGLDMISAQEDGTYGTLRELACQLLEAEWSDGQQIDDLFLVLPKEPQDLWAVRAIKEIFGVSIIWKTDGGWDGLSVDAALGR